MITNLFAQISLMSIWLGKYIFVFGGLYDIPVPLNRSSFVLFSVLFNVSRYEQSRRHYIMV